MAQSTQLLLQTIIKGLSNLKQIQDGLIDELNNFQDQYSKDYKQTKDRLDNISVQIDTTIKEAVAKIKLPTQINQDEIIKLIQEQIKEPDLSQLETTLKEYIDSKIVIPEVPIEEIKDDILESVLEALSKIPAPKDGENATDEQVLSAVEEFMSDKELGVSDEDKAQLKKELKAFLLTEISKIPKAKDSVGIEDIKRVKDDLVITLTDGETKKIRLPIQKQFVGGGGGISLAQAQIFEYASYYVQKATIVPEYRQYHVREELIIDDELILDGDLYIEE